MFNMYYNGIKRMLRDGCAGIPNLSQSFHYKSHYFENSFLQEAIATVVLLEFLINWRYISLPVDLLLMNCLNNNLRDIHYQLVVLNHVLNLHQLTLHVRNVQLDSMVFKRCWMEYFSSRKL